MGSKVILRCFTVECALEELDFVRNASQQAIKSTSTPIVVTIFIALRYYLKLSIITWHPTSSKVCPA